MSLQLSTAIRNARLDAIEQAVGASPVLEIRSGSVPADCAAADSGVVLASMALPADWMAAASNGSIAKNGAWEDASANANGLAGHFRIKAGAVCHLQGLASQPWAASAPFSLNQHVNNNGLVYKCVAAGTSAGSGGPTGTGAGIGDGSCAWDYVGTTDLVLDNGNIATGQQISITAFTITDPNG